MVNILYHASVCPTMPDFRVFRAMAVRAAIATGTDGIVFSVTSSDTLDKNWEALTEETRKNWIDLSELLTEILRTPLTVNDSTDKTVTH